MHSRSDNVSRGISGGVLAGGEGRRFGGADKGWIEHAGRPFIRRILDSLEPQVDDITVSANRNLDRYRGLGWPVVSDRLGEGPLAGLLRLLETAPQPWLFTVPCDALQLAPDLALELARVQREQDADIVVLADDDGVHPTVSLTRTALAADLEDFLRAGGRSVQSWQARHRVARARRGGCLVNVNDAAALAALMRAPLATESAHG